MNTIGDKGIGTAFSGTGCKDVVSAVPSGVMVPVTGTGGAAVVFLERVFL